MKIRVFDSYEQMSRAAAELVAAQLLIQPDSHVGLTAGSTPVGMFAELVRIYQEGGTLSFSQARFYNLEEKMGLPPEDESTCRSYLHRHLLDHVDASADQLLLPDSMAHDVETACTDYEALFRSLPGGRLDLQILGIGKDAHIGMNRPNQALIAACHPVQTESALYAAMGVSSILLARRIILLANGESKAQAVANMCTGQVTTAIPATLLQLHPNVVVLLDKPAASLL